MRTAPAWIGWAALAAAAAGCCRMQPPSPVDSLESTWTRLRESGEKPAPAPAPATTTVPEDAVPPGPPPGPVPAPAGIARPSPIPLEVPPARGETTAPDSPALPLPAGAAGNPGARAGATTPLAIPGAGGAAPDSTRPPPLSVDSSGQGGAGSSSAGLPSPGIPSSDTSPSARPGLAAPSPSVPPSAGGDRLPLEVGSADAPQVGSLVRRESFLPPLRNLMVPLPATSPSLDVGPGRGASAGASSPAVPLPTPAAAKGATSGPSLPSVPAPAAIGVERSPTNPPKVGKAPEILGAKATGAPSEPLPSRALERASADNPEREAARRARDEAALREREAEAGVLRQFLRRVLRLDPPASSEPPARPEVSEEAPGEDSP